MGKYYDYSIEYFVCFFLFILFVVCFVKVSGRKLFDIVIKFRIIVFIYGLVL